VKHIPLEFRPLTAALAQLPFKTLCGEQQREVGTGDMCSGCLSQLLRIHATPSFDISMKDFQPEEAFTSNKITPADAVKEATKVSNRDGFLSQDDYQRILGMLEPKDHYPFRMNLLGHAIHIRTGSVNIVDRVEPEVDGLGDASTTTENLWSGIPMMNRPEMNSDPGGSAELDFGKRRRTEGTLEDDEEKEAEMGQNLTSLTIASLQSDLNKLLGMEAEQARRYADYADVLRLAGRHELADDVGALATTKLVTVADLRAAGARLDVKVMRIASFRPEHSEVVGHILGELWYHENEILQHRLGCNDVYVDPLMKMAKKAQTAGDILPGPSEPFPSQPKMWNDSYHNENAFEDTDKLGSVYGMGEECHNCGHPLALNNVVPCELCNSGKLASYPQPACYMCLGSGRICVCKCGELAFVESPYRPMARWATWKRIADAVKRVTRFADIPVHVEYDKGDTKRYADGNSRFYHVPYGFIPGTTGADGEPIDVYLGAYPAHKAYVVNQMKPDGSFDEEKVMLGFRNSAVAEAIYRSHYPKNAEGQFGGIRELGLEQFHAEYLHPQDEDAYTPKIMKQIPMTVESDHGPGDSDGCETGTPQQGFRESLKGNPKLEGFVKMVMDPAALGSIATEKPDFPISNLKNAPPMPPGITTLGDIVKAMQAPKAQPAKKTPKPKATGNKSVDSLQDTIHKVTEGGNTPEIQKALSGMEKDPVAGKVATQLGKMLSNPEFAEKTKALLSEMLTQGPPAPKPKTPQQAPAQNKPAPQQSPQPTPQQAPAQTKPAPQAPNVDFSPVVSPAEQAWAKEAGELKRVWDEMWALMAGDSSFRAEKVADMPGGAETPSSEPQYDSQMQGPLWEDRDDFGQHDQDELMGVHAGFELGFDDVQ
jgi:hypothetical protein